MTSQTHTPFGPTHFSGSQLLAAMHGQVPTDLSGHALIVPDQYLETDMAGNIVTPVTTLTDHTDAAQPAAPRFDYRVLQREHSTQQTPDSARPFTYQQGEMGNQATPSFNRRTRNTPASRRGRNTAPMAATLSVPLQHMASGHRLNPVGPAPFFLRPRRNQRFTSALHNALHPSFARFDRNLSPGMQRLLGLTPLPQARRQRSGRNYQVLMNAASIQPVATPSTPHLVVVSARIDRDVLTPAGSVLGNHPVQPVHGRRLRPRLLAPAPGQAAA